MVEFNRMVIDAVAPIVPAIKPQFAFYEALGAPGLRRSKRPGDGAGRGTDHGRCKTERHRKHRRSLCTIHSCTGWPVSLRRSAVNPWMGADTLDPFLNVCARTGGGLFVLVRTTTPAAAGCNITASPVRLTGRANLRERPRTDRQVGGRARSGGWRDDGR